MADTDTTGVGESVVDTEQGRDGHSFGASELSVELQALRDVLIDGIDGAKSSEHRGELTISLDPAALPAALVFCRDDNALTCELLSDVSAVHWPGGTVQENDQETTGWPTFTEEVGEGHIEVDYILRSVSLNHWFRLRVSVDDTAPVVPSAATTYSSANFLEREVFDLMGVEFSGHPQLTRIMMPDDWDGHPHRKDYPLGGVEVMFKGETVPPPDERDY